MSKAFQSLLKFLYLWFSSKKLIKIFWNISITYILSLIFIWAAQKIFDFHLDHYRDHRTFEAIRLRDDIDYEDADALSFKVVKSELDHKGTLYKGLLTDAMQFSGLLFTMRLKQKYPHLLEDIKSKNSNQDVSFSLKKFSEEFIQPALEKDTLTIVTEVAGVATTWISLIHKVYLTERQLVEFASSNPVF